MLGRHLLRIVAITVFFACVLAAGTAQAIPVQSSVRRLTDPVPDPAQPGVLWFATTGHTLRGSFLDYWQHNGGLAQFGYPLTEEFTEPFGPYGKPYTVQYFERNRFEHHPENQGSPYEVLLGTLGTGIKGAAPPVAALPSPAVYFPQTGHNLTGAFLGYWQAHGALALLGYPITEPAMERSPTDGKDYLVQWFERARMELHPELAGTPYEVQLGLLGIQLAQSKGYTKGSYPEYGHAADYSWFAGYYKSDPRKCAVCGCSTADFIGPADPSYSDARAVLPYGSTWDRILNDNGLTATTEPQQLLVLFGKLDDPGSIATGGATPSCRSPRFLVTGFQFNPPR